MALLVSLTDTDIQPWVEVFESELSNMDIRIYPDVGDASEIEYVAAWQHPFGEYKKYSNGTKHSIYRIYRYHCN
jgi:glyoxylate/hydroxypyruvate reductase A